LVFELTGHKVGLDGMFEEKDNEQNSLLSSMKKLDPLMEIQLKKYTKDAIINSSDDSEDSVT